MQHFQKLREENFLYVDKTEWIYHLITEGVAYFFSRPRRFGKSILVSTLEAVFQGKKTLFSGLWIDRTDYEWKKFPVIHLDFSTAVSSSPETLMTSLQEMLKEAALKYGIKNIHRPFPSFTLSALMTELSKIAPVVILIDEYDKPLVHHLEDSALVKKNRDVLRDFYATIKSLDQYLHFVFVTGVSKFSKVSLFSGMNNLKDISLYDPYADLLGLTEKEIETYLRPDVEALAQKQGTTAQYILNLLKTWYNGYRYALSPNESKVYNPLSVFSYLGKLANYWFTSATPTFAIELVKNRSFPISDFENGVLAGKEMEASHEVDTMDIATLLFQTGYLTIGDYNEKTGDYFLKFPNEEVRRSFEALEQILSKNYPKKHSLDGLELILVGVNFDTASRSLNQWKVHTLGLNK